jgi:hypothetical protein
MSFDLSPLVLGKAILKRLLFIKYLPRTCIFPDHKQFSHLCAPPTTTLMGEVLPLTIPSILLIIFYILLAFQIAWGVFTLLHILDLKVRRQELYIEALDNTFAPQDMEDVFELTRDVTLLPWIYCIAVAALLWEVLWEDLAPVVRERVESAWVWCLRKVWTKKVEAKEVKKVFSLPSDVNGDLYD